MKHEFKITNSHMTLHAGPIKREYASFFYKELIKRDNMLFLNGP